MKAPRRNGNVPMSQSGFISYTITPKISFSTLSKIVRSKNVTNNVVKMIVAIIDILLSFLY